MGVCLIAEGRPGEALALAAQFPMEWVRLTTTALAQYDLGNVQESNAALDSLVARHATTAAVQVAEVHAWRGDKEKAFEWLDRAHVQRDPGVRFASYNPLFRKIHDDPRWKEFLAKLTVAGGARLPEARPHEAAALPSIAVLPFADMSPKHDQEYFADGVAEEIRNALARVEGMKVIGRTSSSSFKGKPDDLKTIGQKLGVANVLEGSLRKDGNDIRVTAQLIRVKDGTHLWSESYDRKLSGIFKVQDEIAKAVVGALKIKLLPGEAAAMERSKTTPDAYLQYLLGYQHWIRAYEGDIAKSVAAYERALALDPAYSPAWAGLAWSLDILAEDQPGLDRLLSMKRRANEAAERAVTLGPVDGRAYYARGGLRASNRHEWAAGLADLEKAITLEGGDAAVYRVHGYILAALGRLPEAIASLNRATDLEPLAARGWVLLGRLYNGSGQFDKARRAFQTVLELAPDYPTIQCRLGDVLLLEGRTAEALLAAEACRADMWRLTLTAMADYSLGRERESSKALGTLIERHSISAAYQIAEVSAWRGENDKAFEWLARADAQMDGGLMDLKYSPFLRPLHADPRWKAFLKKMNLPVD
jgi:TolB-like protein/Tfp pilus assembly protein PilF